MIRTILSASLVTLLAVTAAQADDAPSRPAGLVSPLVVTASRAGDTTRADLVGASVTVIDDQAMQDRSVRVVSDVLRDAPGVAVSRLGAIGGQTQVRLRGAEGNHTLVLIDGVKASDPYSGEYDFGTLIADEASRIELLRGQQSALYGSDAIGGVISYTTLTGAQAPGVRQHAETGGMGTWDGGARIAGVAGRLDYAASIAALRTDGYPTAPGGTRDVGSDSLGASLKTTWSLAPNLQITAVGRYSHTRADTNDSGADSRSPDFGRILDSPGVHYVNDGYYGLMKGQLDLLGGRWTNAVTLQIADTERRGYDVANPFAPPAGQPIVRSSGDRGQRRKLSLESAYRFGSDQLKQRITLALDAEHERERTTVSPFGAFLGYRNTDNLGLVGAYDLTLGDRLSLGGSLRHDENNRFADPTTYRVQGSYRFETGTRLHAAAGSGVKAPSFSELFDFSAGRFIGNPNLKPERSEGFEAGLDQTLLDGALNIGATYFRNHLEDEISTDFSIGVARPVNLAGKTRQRGVELFAAGKLGPDWRLDAGYTYLHAPQDRAVIRNGAFAAFHGQAVRRAKAIASANLTWAPADQPFSGTLTVRYNGRQNDVAFINPSFTPVLVSLKRFTLVNLSARYRLTDKVELFGRAENLLGQRYQEVFSFQAAGRTAYAGARLAF